MVAGILLALLSARGIGPKKANAILKSLKSYDLEDLETAIETILAPKLDPQEWKALLCTGNDMFSRSIEAGINVIDFLSESYPSLLKRLENPPLAIFVKGHPSAMTTQLPVAIVGSRSPSTYAEQHGKSISQIVSCKASAVISGLAIGCDTIAHREALLNCVPTVAVVAHGLDTIYPKANAKLATQIIESGGCLVSEYPVGIPPRPNQFIARDRIQAGLSHAGVLLQSSSSGGSMHAMRSLQKIRAAIGALVPPANARHAVEWGGSVDLLELKETIALDPELVGFLDDIGKLLVKNVPVLPRKAIIQETLF